MNNPSKTSVNNFERQIEKSKSSGCWNWTGSIRKDGYGRFTYGGHAVLAHRVAYSFFKSAIPEGMCLDHLCRNKRCVNPDHLEVVTHKENVLRGISLPAINSRATHCLNGHVLSGGNLGSSVKRRVCKLCDARRQREYKSRKRQAA